MALIERLTRDPSEPVGRWIPVHDFFAAAHEIVSGRLTSAQVQTALAMTAPDLVDWNALVALMPPANQAANGASWESESWHSRRRSRRSSSRPRTRRGRIST